MAYKCITCVSNDVEHPGEVCELCAIGQDPYASSMQNNGSVVIKERMFNNQAETNSYVPSKGKNRKILLGGAASIDYTDPYGNSMVTQKGQDNTVLVHQAGQVQANTTAGQSVAISNTINNHSMHVNNNMPLTSGITKNINVDMQNKSVLRKLIRTLFSGIPYTLDNDITMFQVFPDYTGTSKNVIGNACDQVIVYGKLNAGAVSENNDVEIYGHRDSDNNIVAKKIVNKASGTTITPDRVIPAPVIWGITIVVFALLAVFVSTRGIEGIVWAALLILCLTNLPLFFKIIFAVIGVMYSMIGRRHRRNT